MKKLTFLIAFALVFFYGCNKQETNPAADNQQVEKSYDFVLNLDGKNPVWELVTLDGLLGTPSNSGSETTKANNGNSGHTHGDFPNVVFSGTQNNGGTHGSATVSLGPWVFTLETECVMVEGNEAVYGGTIAERVGPPAPPNAPFNVGDLIYLKVIDNGQGNNAPADQYNGRITSKFAGDSQCGILTPSNAHWDLRPDYDVPEPGSIKVNN